MNNRNCVCTIRLLINRALVLFLKYARSFSVSMKAAPKHPPPLPLVPFYNVCRVPFLPSTPSYLGTCMPSSCNLCLVCPEYLIPLL